MIWPFKQKFRGMIRPDMALDDGGSKRVADRKSLAMVGYLRMRRVIADPYYAVFKKQHLAGKSELRRAHLRIMKIKRNL